MRSTLSERMIKAGNAPETGEVVAWLVELDHADFQTPIRLVNDTQDLTHGGAAYTAHAFTIGLPDEGDGAGVPVMTLTLDNTALDHVADFRTVSRGEVSARACMVLVSEPDVNQTGWLEGQINAVDVTAEAITATITIEPILERKVLSKRMDQSNAPGLY